MLPDVKGEEFGTVDSVFGEGERNVIKKENLAEWKEMVSGYMKLLGWLKCNLKFKVESYLNVSSISEDFYLDLESHMPHFALKALNPYRPDHTIFIFLPFFFCETL